MVLIFHLYYAELREKEEEKEKEKKEKKERKRNNLCLLLFGQSWYCLWPVVFDFLCRNSVLEVLVFALFACEHSESVSYGIISF